HPARKVKQFIDSSERRVHDHRTGGFSRNLALMAEGDSNSRRAEGRGVVDAVADKERGCTNGFRARDRDLFFGAAPGVDLDDANAFGKVAHFRFAVSRHEQDSIEVMPRLEMADE